MKAVGKKEAYENLANAIIISAVRDYKAALIHLKRNPDIESARKNVKRQEKFFYSEWYETLTNLDGSYLIQKLKEKVNEEMEKMVGEEKKDKREKE